MEKIYYVYQYVRDDGRPYYVGKGKGNRIIKKHNGGITVPKDRSKIQFVREDLTEQEALKEERKQIAKWGRKDLGTGCLYNHTDGGEAGYNRKLTEAHKQKLREVMSDVVKKTWNKNRHSKHKQHMNNLWGENRDYMLSKQKTYERTPEIIEKMRQSKLAKNIIHPNRVNDPNRPLCACGRVTPSQGLDKSGKRRYGKRCQRCIKAS